MFQHATTNRASIKQRSYHQQDPPAKRDPVQSYRSRDDPDAALVDALRLRELTAFDNLVKRYERRLLNVAQKITKNREDAEDAVQDSFLKVFRHLDSFRGDSKFVSWLTRITINQALMIMRRNTQRVVSLDERMETEDGMALREIKAREYTPEQFCSQREFERLLLDRAAGMRQSARLVLELSIVEDLSEAEIAQALGLTQSAVKARLYRAKQDLRKTICKHFPSAKFLRIAKIASAVTSKAEIREDLQHRECGLLPGALCAEGPSIHAVA
jgi:RNA polymerase sigma-70 factor, ECF subfamily